MNAFAKIAGLSAAAMLVAGVFGVPVRAQIPEVVKPIIVDTALPIIINTIKPKPMPGVGKFEGFVMHANIAQITVRARGNDMSLQTFSLSEQASAQMQAIVDKGGYQYGDKVSVLYNQSSEQAVKIKGKASKSL